MRQRSEPSVARPASLPSVPSPSSERRSAGFLSMSAATRPNDASASAPAIPTASDIGARPTIPRAANGPSM